MTWLLGALGLSKLFRRYGPWTRLSERRLMKMENDRVRHDNARLRNENDRLRRQITEADLSERSLRERLRGGQGMRS